MRVRGVSARSECGRGLLCDPSHHWVCLCLRASASLLLWKVVCGGRESQDGACAHLILECPRLPADMKKT